VAQALCVLLTAGVLWLWLLFVADNLLNLRPATRLALGTAFVAAHLAALAWLYLRRWRVPLDERRTAVFLEQRYGVADNRLINAVHLAADPAVPADVRAYFTQTATETSRGFRLARVMDWRRLGRLARPLAVAAAVMTLYAVLFTDHARNAFIRFANPATEVAPLNYTQFEVTPGSLRLAEGSSVLIRARGRRLGRAVERLDILVSDGASNILHAMQPEDGGGVFELVNLSETTRYTVRNRNDASLTYTVTVVPKPRLERLTFTVTPPAYTRRPPRQEPPTARQVRALAGATLRIEPGLPASMHAAFFRDGQPAAATDGRLETTLDRSCRLALDVTEADGLTHAAAWFCEVEAVADEPPAVRFVNTEMNQQVGLGQEVPVQVAARDDCGVRNLVLYTRINGEDVPLKSYDYGESREERREAAMIRITPERFAVNATYRIWGRATDIREPAQGGVTVTPVTLHVIDLSRQAPAGEAADPYVRLFAALSEALAQQKAAQTGIAGGIDRAGDAGALGGMLKQQEPVDALLGRAAAVARELRDAGRIEPALEARIGALYSGPSKTILQHLREVPGVADTAERRVRLNAVVLEQTELIRALQDILGEIGRRKRLDDLAALDLKQDEQDQKTLERLNQLRDDLSKYQETQRDLLDKLGDIDRKEPEDWAEDEEELLGKLAARQDDLANFFKSAFDDLSKIENQDFSNSMLADELLELYEELQRAGDALKAKKTEIATLAEEMGLEMAETMETNLERWLADAKDAIKWNAEEGGDSPDVPLQDLPQEMTDIIGDLIDDVNDMEDAEDSTNSYMMAGDVGIGWGVSDGNIDDMSAKGITGNAMPNNNEVGGRSGEGRSGKSSGQFVEKTATGKGGRDTPTRLTYSPFEKGTVEDTSKDPQGGATGGGKQSGLGGEGLRGITPDQQAKVGQRLPEQTVELKQKAEALVRRLSVYNLPTGDLEAAVAQMEAISRQGSTAPGLGFAQVQSDIVSALQDARTAIQVAAGAGGDRTHRNALPRAWSVKYQANEPTPAGYESAVEAYFKALAGEE